MGDGPNGNIAIDDIKISRGECRHFGDCDFEDNNLCDYTNSPSSQIDWIPKRSLFLGPSQSKLLDISSFDMFFIDFQLTSTTC